MGEREGLPRTAVSLPEAIHAQEKRGTISAAACPCLKAEHPAPNTLTH